MSKSNHQQRVEKFMKLAGQEVPENILLEPSKDIRLLRAKLILEEALETIKALGVGIVMSHKFEDKLIDNIEDLLLIPDLDLDLEKVIDGCADLSVVTVGTLSALGIHDEQILEAVDKNNLEKFGPGGHRREDGKWIKPEGHKPPDLLSIINNQKSQ